ncbi:hypothetical protein AB9P05_18605 [Roseivirga sp. BDSF3-8]|uniref:hypothetical protein n=1 Tax=Roseivirga sp. BDSF3-8 TaxID=3241598 RepID=UPI0035321EE8
MKTNENLWKSALMVCLFFVGIFGFTACNDQAAEPDAPDAGLPGVEVEVYSWSLPEDLDLTSEQKVALIERLTEEGDFQYATLEYGGTREGYNELLSGQPAEESCSPWIKVSCCCTEWAYSSYCYGTCTYKKSCQEGNKIVEEYRTERTFQSCSYFNV